MEIPGLAAVVRGIEVLRMVRSGSRRVSREEELGHPQEVVRALVRLLPSPVVLRIDEHTAADEPSDWCRCGRKVVHRIPSPAVARVGA